MKKIIGLILIITFSLTSCSSSDDDSGNNGSSINPPNWIQGTWLGEVDGINSGLGFKFTSDDFCSVVGSQTSCFKEPVNQSQGLITVDEQIDNENYIISINNNNTITNTFHFRKYSETEIEVVQSTGLNPRYVKQ
ncbi:hypothetical protein ACFFU9_10260 [Mariniflexile ostreae]|uniref:Lipocalin-like protein n=1 Tax=Mariniflexile ostreae TaxID=1520892 RepID=A0ABV5FCF6_9FLAO